MVNAHFRFDTTAFDDSAEVRARNVNGIVGHTLAGWLASQLTERGCKASPVWAEDHGWDFSIEHAGSVYLCACCVAGDDGAISGPATEGHVSLHKSRTVVDKIMGRNKYAADDPVTALIHAALSGSSDVRTLERDE